MNKLSNILLSKKNSQNVYEISTLNRNTGKGRSEIKMKYDPEQNKCVQIDSCDLEKLKAYYCMGEDTPLSCYSGQYIDYSNNQISCKTGCSEFSVIRQPGTGKNPGICNSQCPENVQTCPSNNLNNYVSGFVCNGGYYRIAYQCLDLLIKIH